MTALMTAREEATGRSRPDGVTAAELAHDVIPGPLGPLLAVATSAGLVSLSLLPDDPDAVVERVLSLMSAGAPATVTGTPGRAASHLERLEHQLARYFDGTLNEFDVALDWSLVSGRFARRVLETTAEIPYGEVATYTQVAEGAGNPRAARAAGNALAANPLMVVVPCHRVVPSGGGVGRYGGGSDRKVWLLELEGARPGTSAG